jgi:hypothetical protein
MKRFALLLAVVFVVGAATPSHASGVPRVAARYWWNKVVRFMGPSDGGDDWWIVGHRESKKTQAVAVKPRVGEKSVIEKK